MNCRGWSRGDSGEEHEHQSDAVLGSVMVFRLAAGAVAEVVARHGLAKSGCLSGCTVVLGIVAATEEYFIECALACIFKPLKGLVHEA